MDCVPTLCIVSSNTGPIVSSLSNIITYVYMAEEMAILMDIIINSSPTHISASNDEWACISKVALYGDEERYLAISISNDSNDATDSRERRSTSLSGPRPARTPKFCCLLFWSQMSGSENACFWDGTRIYYSVACICFKSRVLKVRRYRSVQPKKTVVLR